MNESNVHERTMLFPEDVGNQIKISLPNIIHPHELVVREAPVPLSITTQAIVIDFWLPALTRQEGPIF